MSFPSNHLVGLEQSRLLVDLKHLWPHLVRSNTLTSTWCLSRSTTTTTHSHICGSQPETPVVLRLCQTETAISLSACFLCPTMQCDNKHPGYSFGRCDHTDSAAHLAGVPTHTLLLRWLVFPQACTHCCQLLTAAEWPC